ncbi:MAG: SDR family oxidoreductase [Bacteroidota bacterium]
MKIFILGSEGFIGKSCIDYFSDKGHDIVGADIKNIRPAYPYFQVNDFRNDVGNFFLTEQFDFCINAAGNGNVSFSVAEPLSDFYANCQQVIDVLEAIRKSKQSCRYLHISSAAVYGNPEKLPVCESDTTHPTSPYGWHKLMSEHLCKEYTEIYGLKTCCIRPFSVFGPGLKKQIFWDVFQKTTLSKHIEIWGTGNESRDYIYISDLMNAIDCIINKSDFDGHIYNVANGNEIFIRDIMPKFLQLIDPSLSLFFNQLRRKGDPLNWCADISALSSLGYKSCCSLDDGLRKTIHWMKNEHGLHK